jgi:hypothetical protein
VCAAVVGARLQRAVVQPHPLARALDRLLAATAHLPRHAELERLGGEAHGHLDARSVGERLQQLLDDPVGRQLDAGRQRLWVALDLQARARALRAHEQRLQVRERGLGRHRRIAVVVAQHADDRAHLVERAPALLLDLGQRGSGGPGIRGLRAALGQLGERAESALEQLVELGGQARALGGDLQPAAFIARMAQLTGARLELAHEPPTRAHEAPDPPHRQGHRGDERDGVGRRAVLAVGQADGDADRKRERQAEQRAVAIQPGAGGEGEDEHERQHEAAADEGTEDRGVQEQDGERRREGSGRRDAAPQDRHGDGREERHGESVGLDLLVRDLREQVHDRQRAHDERDRDVEPADPLLHGCHGGNHLLSGLLR